MAAEAPSLFSIYDSSSQDLLKTIDDASYCPDAELEAILVRNKTRLLDGINKYKRPDDASKTKFTAAKVLGKEFVGRISDSLDLAHDQSSELFRQFLFKLSRERGYLLRRESKVKKAEGTAATTTTDRFGAADVTALGFEYDQANLDEVMFFYCSERRALLQCVSSLIRWADEDDNSVRTRMMKTFLDSLLEDNALRKSLLMQYQNTLKWTPSKTCNAPLLARNCMIEQEELLECLVALHYQAAHCSAEQYLELYKLAADTAAWGSAQQDSVLSQMTPEEWRPRVQRFGVLFTVLLIECLDLESLSPEMNAEAADLLTSAQLEETLKKHEVTRDAKVSQAIDDIVVKQLTGKHKKRIAPQQWCMLLAWSLANVRVTVLQLALGKPVSDALVDRYRSNCATSISHGALSYLRQALTGQVDPYTPASVSLMAYKSVFKGLVGALICSFHPRMLGLSGIASLSCECMRDEPSLCLQFWDNDYHVEAGRSVLQEAVAQFPIHPTALLQYLTALCGNDRRCSVNVFNFMTTLPSLCTDADDEHNSSNYAFAHRMEEVLVVTRSFFFFPAPGSTNGSLPPLRLDPGIEGVVLSIPGKRPVIQWNCQNSGWAICLLFLDQYLHATSQGNSGDEQWLPHSSATDRVCMDEDGDLDTSNQAQQNNNQHHTTVNTTFHQPEMLAGAGHRRAPPAAAQLGPTAMEKAILVLELLDATVSTNPKLMDNIEDHLSHYFGVDPRSMLLTTRILAILERCETLARPPPRLLTVCIRCLEAIAHTKALQLASGLLRSGVIPNSSQRAGSHDGGCVPRTLRTWERVQGVYNTTLAFMKLANTLIHCAREVTPTAERHDDADARQSLLTIANLSLTYVLDEIFAWHGQWRFKKRLQRFEIAQLSLQVFNQVLWLGERDASMYTSLFHRLLNESALFSSLLMAIVGSVDTASGAAVNSPMILISSGHIDEGPKDVTPILERLCTRAFTVLDRLLAQTNTLTKDSQSSFDITPLERALFSRTGQEDGSRHLISVLCSYVSHEYRPAVIAATKVLTRLCHVALRWRPRPPSMVGYLGSEANVYRDNYIARLSDEHEHDELRCAILDLLAAAVQTQPALAALFLGVDTSQIAADSTLTSAPPTTPVTTAVPNGPQSCLRVVIQLFKSSSISVTLRASATGLLRALWSRATDYHAVLSTLRVDSFWKDLHAVFRACDGDIKSVSESPLHSTAACITTCFSQQSRAHILYILSIELFCTPNASMSPALKDLIIGCALESGILRSATHERVDGGVDKALHAAVSALHLSLDDFAVSVTDRVHGENYCYDTEAMLQLLISKRPTDPESEEMTRRWQHYVHQAIGNIRDANRGWSLTHARLQVLRSWRCLLEVIADRTPTVLNGEEANRTIVSHMFREIAAMLEEPGGTDHRCYIELASILLTLLKPRGPAESVLDSPQCFGLIHALTNGLKNGTGEKWELASIRVPIYTCCMLLLQYVRRNNGDKIAAEHLALALMPHVCVSLHHHLTPALSALTDRVEDVDMTTSTTTSAKNGEEKSALEAANDVTCVILALLTELLLHAVDHATWLPILGSHDTLASLLNSVCDAISARDRQQFVEMTLQLFLSSATIAAFARCLALQGLVYRLSNSFEYSQASSQVNSDAGFTTEGHILPYLSNERNGWHKVWCLTLGVLRAVLSTLKHEEDFASLCIQFCGVHHHKFRHIILCPAQSVNGGNKLSLATLEEAVVVLGFLCTVSEYRKHWTAALPANVRDIVECSAAGTALMVRVLERSCCSVNPSSTAGAATRAADAFGVSPITRMEQSLNESLGAALVAESTTAMPSVQAASGIAQRSSVLAQQIEVLVLEYFRHILVLQRHLTVNSFLTDNAQSPVYANVFSDSDDVPNLGRLISLQQVYTRQLRKDGDNRGRMLFVIEHALNLTVTQTILHFKSNNDTHQLRMDMSRELSQLLQTLCGKMNQRVSSSPQLRRRSTDTPTESSLAWTNSPDQAFFRFVHKFVLSW